MGAKTSLNMNSFQNTEFCNNYTIDIESSNHDMMPPQEPIDEDDQMPPLEPNDDDDPMPPLEPIDDDDQMPPLEPIDDDDPMPPLEPIDDDDPMPPLETIQDIGKGAESLCATNSEGDRRSPEEFDESVDYDHMPPLESIYNRFLHFATTEPRSSPVVFTNDTIVNTVIESFISRSNLGFKKYNKTLDREDLSTADWVNHTQEELMDAILYLERLKKNLQK